MRLYQNPVLKRVQGQDVRTLNGNAVQRKKSKDKKETESKIHFFQQDTPKSLSRQPVNEKFPFFDNETGNDAERLNARIAKLDKELQEMERRVKDGTFWDPLIQDLPKDEQDLLRTSSREAELVEASDSELDRLPPDVEIEADVPPEKRKYLQELNTTIIRSLKEQDSRELRTELYTSYARFRQFLPNFIAHIPDAAWEVLMNASASTELHSDASWAQRRIQIFEDMESAKKTPSIGHKQLYLQALRGRSFTLKAIRYWQDMQSEVRDDKMALARHELLGVILFASKQDPLRAERLASEYLSKEPPQESRILIGILAAWLERGDEVGAQHAWSLYLRMKAHLAESITMQDYDNVTMAFLRGKRPDLALAVFKDMMLKGQITGEDSLELFRKARGLMAYLQHEEISVELFNGIALTSLTILPRRLQNRFFFGSWLKKLLGMGETDAAAQVIDLMYERGVPTDAKHLNGIVGAWMRSDNSSDNEKGERLAWSMVHHRLEFVKKRANQRRSNFDETNVELVKFLPKDPKRECASANIETLSLLLNHYVNRRMEDNVALIQRTLVAAEIRPDHFFMNHLIYHEILRGRLDMVWAKFIDTFADIPPDLETFETLWSAEKTHLERLAVGQPDEFPSPRLVMREMIRWFVVQDTRKQRKAQDYFERKLYEDVVRCFCLAKDFSGLVVACYFLRDAFHAFPNATSAKIITMSLARMGVGIGIDAPPEWKPRRHRKSGNPRLKKNTDQLVQAHQAIWQQRIESVREAGFVAANFTDEMHSQEALFVLATFLKDVLLRITPQANEALVSENIDNAASDMSAAGIDMSDPLEAPKDTEDLALAEAVGGVGE